MRTKLILIFVFLFLVLFYPKTVMAKDSFVTLVNPVRGLDFWKYNDQFPLTFPEYQKQVFESHNLVSTWLLRPDLLFSNDLVSYFQSSRFNSDELGLFLEVTPSWAKASDVTYKGREPWYSSQELFLSGYNPRDREKLLITALEKYRSLFGHLPKTVGAWHVDPYTANFLSSTYSITTILICADQFSTDGYQIWGGWWGVPYYPAKSNLLYPAGSIKDKLPVVVLWWAARDPVNGYGDTVSSLYSVQANDYLGLGLTTDYFSQLADIYLEPANGLFGQLTVGLENDSRYSQYAQEFSRQITELTKKDCQFLTASGFSLWYQRSFPLLSPNHTLESPDLLGKGSSARWEMSPSQRIGYVQDPVGAWQIRDQRFYQPVWPDPYWQTKNSYSKLYWSVPAVIDKTQNLTNYQPEKVLRFYRGGYFWLIPILFLVLFIFIKKIPVFIKLFLLIASVSFSLPMLASGRLYSFGLGFWGPNGHDAIWHLALIESFQKGLPVLNPVFSGTRLTNYHWGFDLLSALIIKFSGISSLDYYFRFFPLTCALLLGLLCFYLAKKLSHSLLVAFCFIFLTYFNGSFGWLVTLIKNHSLGGESLFWSMQSISTLINPPFALSLVMTLSILLLWLRGRPQKSLMLALFVGLLTGLVLTVKVYAGILLVFSFLAFLVIQIFRHRLSPFDLIVAGVAVVSSFIALTVLGVFSAPSSLVFSPLWFVHSLIESLDKLYLPNLAVFRQNLSRQLFSWKFPFFIVLEFALTIVFIIGNLGTRVFGFSEIFSRLKHRQFSDFDLLIFPFLTCALVFPLVFVQKGTTWNTIQFLYYFLFFANFYFAVFLAKIFKACRFFCFYFLLLVSLPTSFATLKNYLGFPSPAAVSYPELEALYFLRHQPPGTVLTAGYDPYPKADYQTPIPLYLYETTAYVSALSGQSSYLADEMNLEITGYPYKTRLQSSRGFFTTTNVYEARGFLLNNHIAYLYLLAGQEPALQPEDLSLKMIFSNGAVKIFSVNR